MSDWRTRLTKRRDELGYSNAELARRADVKPTMLHDILDRGTNPSVSNLFKIAKALNFTLSELYEGALSSRSHRLAITGVYEGGVVLDTHQSGEQPDFAVSFPATNLESVRVRSDLLEPAGYRRGDVLMGVRHNAQAANNIVGKDCILATADGARIVAHPVKHVGPSTYNLRFFHRSQPDREAVEIAWAAPITMIVRD
jgi:transcriptional regulator with XRE-family HTH domain